MDRRTFLQGITAVGAATILPLATARDEAPWTTTELIAELDKMFATREGPPMAFFYLGVAPDLKRYTYVSFAAAVEGGTAAAAEAQLAQYFYDEFSKLPAGPLVWRTKPEFESESIVEFGDVWMTAEQIEDEAWKFVEKSNGRIHRDDTLQLCVPDNVEMDYNSGNYRYCTRKYTLHRMSMRLVLPHLQDVEEHELVKAEGEPTLRV